MKKKAIKVIINFYHCLVCFLVTLELPTTPPCRLTLSTSFNKHDAICFVIRLTAMRGGGRHEEDETQTSQMLNFHVECKRVLYDIFIENVLLFPVSYSLFFSPHIHGRVSALFTLNMSFCCWAWVELVWNSIVSARTSHFSTSPLAVLNKLSFGWWKTSSSFSFSSFACSCLTFFYSIILCLTIFCRLFSVSVKSSPKRSAETWRRKFQFKFQVPVLEYYSD